MAARLGEDRNHGVCKGDLCYSSSSMCFVTYTGQSREEPLLSCNSMYYDMLCFTLLRAVEIQQGNISCRNTARLHQRQGRHEQASISVLRMRWSVGARLCVAASNSFSQSGRRWKQCIEWYWDAHWLYYYWKNSLILVVLTIVLIMAFLALSMLVIKRRIARIAAWSGGGNILAHDASRFTVPQCFLACRNMPYACPSLRQRFRVISRG